MLSYLKLAMTKNLICQMGHQRLTEKFLGEIEEEHIENESLQGIVDALNVKWENYVRTN